MWFCVGLELGRDASIDAAIRRSREQGLSDARRLTGDRRMPATGASSTPPPTGPLKGKKGPGPLCFEPYCDPRLDPFPYSANHTVSDGRKHPPAVLGLPDAWGNLLASPRRRRVAFTRQRGRSLRARRLLRLSSQKGTPIKAVTIVLVLVGFIAGCARAIGILWRRAAVVHDEERVRERGSHLGSDLGGLHVIETHR